MTWDFLCLAGYSPIVPNESRREQLALQARMSQAEFLDHVWRERDAAWKASSQPGSHRRRSRGGWPLSTGPETDSRPSRASLEALGVSVIRRKH
jgi:hypothetical protein